jgi:predicted transcriptional regulator
MTDEEYKIIVKEYEKAFLEYVSYVDQFITSSVNGVVTHAATKSITPEEVDKIHALRERADELQDKWLKASTI